MAKQKKSDWELEAPLDMEATLEELINAPPFKEPSDEKGNSTTVGSRIPSWLHRRITKLIEMRGSPYEIVSDVIRDCVFLGLRIILLRHKMSADWGVEVKLAAAVDATGASRRVRHQVDELVDGIDELYRDGDTNMAADKLSDYIRAASELENGWHKSRIFRLLDENRIVRDVLNYCQSDVQKIMRTDHKTIERLMGKE